jgi:hypothetical protein
MLMILTLISIVKSDLKNRHHIAYPRVQKKAPATASKSSTAAQTP